MRFAVSVFLLLSGIILCTGQSYTSIETAPKGLIKQFDTARELRKASRTNEQVIVLLHRVLRRDDRFIDAHLLLGEVYYEEYRIAEAIGAFENAIALDSFYAPRILYSLGRIYGQSGEYARARLLLERYLVKGEPDDRQCDITKGHLKRYAVAEALMARPVAFEPHKLPGPVNTDHSEALPAFTVDGQFMLFVRKTGSREDIFIAHWDTATQMWSSPGPVSAINTAGNEGAPSVSADGSVIAFTACGRADGLGSCDLYLWERRDGVWQRPYNATALNSSAWDAQPSLTPDGNGIYFSSNRPGGHGGRDIWYARREQGHWTTPVNPGAPINTPGNEESPFLYFDGRTLYFMSDGHPGMGGYDLFRSTRQGGQWTAPENLGYPVNTVDNEGALAIHPDGRHAYFTRDRYHGGPTDLYVFELDESILPPPVSSLEGLVTDAHSNRGLIAEIDVYHLDDATERYHYTSDSDGRFAAVLPHGHTYGIHVNRPGYVFWSGQFALEPQAPYKRQELVVALMPVLRDTLPAVATPVILRNILFATGSAQLLPASEFELQRLASLLRAHTEMHIAIYGHTDNTGSEEFNLRLSFERAKAVYDWLTDAGIDAGRLSYEGFGESRPVASNETEEGRRENRRTEFVILH